MAMGLSGWAETNVAEVPSFLGPKVSFVSCFYMFFHFCSCFSCFSSLEIFLDLVKESLRSCCLKRS